MALADRDAIMDYIAQDNPAAAIDLDDEIEVKAEDNAFAADLSMLFG